MTGPAGHDSAVGGSRMEVARKRSITIAGHETSIRIESLFWDALLAEAARQDLPVNALVARIDAERLGQDPAPNLASAIRQWLFALRGGETIKF